MPDGIPFDTPDGYWHYGNHPTATRVSGARRNNVEARERNEAIRALGEELGEVHYALELFGGIIKIGHTTNIIARHGQFPGSTILAIRPGDREGEKRLHKRLAKNRAYGHEYYYPTPQVIAAVNQMREYFGLEPLAA